MDVLNADWLGICRRVVAAQRAIFDRVGGIEARSVYRGIGSGGDRSLEIDRSCEDAVFFELEALAAEGASFLAVSEERGEVSFGSGAGARIVIDPIDGSLNARRTLPAHSLSIALASGASMADVDFAYVYDFGAGEEFVARRGGGATLGGKPIGVGADRKKLELLGLESASPERSLAALAVLTDRVYRLRVLGSIALSLAYVGAGRFDAMLGLRACRSVDAAAAQLVVREAGGEVAFGEQGIEQAELGLGARYEIAAAGGEVGLAIVRAAQVAAAAPPRGGV